MMLVQENSLDPSPKLPLTSPASVGDIDYSCGSCGYELNLNSCNRNTSIKHYGKSIKRGIITFFSIDETRFNRVEKLWCKPYFVSAKYWGLFQRRTKLLCRKCGNHVGCAYKPSICPNSSLKRRESPPDKVPSSSSSSWGWDGISGAGKYNIKIRALQPSYSGSTFFSII